MPEEAELPGIRLERRAFLKISLGALATALLGCRPGGVLPSPGLDLDALLGEILPEAEGLVTGAIPDEEAHLARVAELAARLDGLPAAPALGRRYAGDVLRRKRPMEILQFRMAPGSRMPCHDHRDYNAVLMGLEGDLEATHYEVVGDDPAPAGPFRVRRTRRVKVVPGACATLARRRDNLHALAAGPRGACFLDIFTRFHPGAASHNVRLGAESGEGIYEAVWG